MILKQAFVECSSNILETLLCDYWNLPKDQYLLLSNHTLLTQKQLFHRELFINSFSLKCSVMFPRCPEHCDTEGTLSECSRNIACRLGWILIMVRSLGKNYFLVRTKLRYLWYVIGKYIFF